MRFRLDQSVMPGNCLRAAWHIKPVGLRTCPEDSQASFLQADEPSEIERLNAPVNAGPFSPCKARANTPLGCAETRIMITTEVKFSA